jgi:hypothetical protein
VDFRSAGKTSILSSVSAGNLTYSYVFGNLSDCQTMSTTKSQIISIFLSLTHLSILSRFTEHLLQAGHSPRLESQRI